MIREHDYKLIALCDGCDAMLKMDPAIVLPVIELVKRRWRVNDRSTQGWQHFCPSCAIEFKADVPLDHEKL
jgi:hypothetical protein